MKPTWLLCLCTLLFYACSHGLFRSRNLTQESPSTVSLPTLTWSYALPILGERDQGADQEVRKIVVATDGSIYLCGETLGHIGANTNKGDQDVFVIKVSAAGEPLWSKMIGTVLSDFCTDMTIDLQDTVIVIGEVGTGLTPGDSAGPFVANLSSSGEERWIKQLTTKQSAYPGGAIVDSQGNVFISGFKFRENIPDGFVQQMTSQGEVSWSVDMSTLTGERASQIFLHQDIIFVLGTQEGEETTLLSTQWARHNGELINTAMYHTPFAKKARGWMTNSGLEILIPGMEPEGGHTQAVLVAFSPDFQWKWRALLEGSDAVPNTQLFDVTLDPVGNAYVVAVAYQQSQNLEPMQNAEFFVQSFDTQGRSRYRITPEALKWRGTKLPTHWNQTYRKIAVDPHQNLYVLIGNTLHKFSSESSIQPAPASASDQSQKE